MYAGAAAGGRRAGGGLAAGEHLPVGLRRPHQPRAVRRPGHRGHASAGQWLAAYRHESAHLNERATSSSSGRSRARSAGCTSGRSSASWPAGSSPGCQSGTRSRPAQRIGPHEVRLADGRLRAHRSATCSSRRGDRVVGGETVIAPLARRLTGDLVTTPAAPGRRRILARWRLRVADRGAGRLAAPAAQARAGPAPRPERLHDAQHDVRPLVGAPGVPRALHARGVAHRRLDRPRHRRRLRRPARRGHVAVRPAARLPRRPRLLRPGPGRARPHLGARRVAGAGLARRVLLARLLGVPAGSVQRDDRPARRQALLRRACPSPGSGGRRHGDDPRPGLPVLRPGDRAVAGLVPARSSASSRRCSW